MTERKHYVEAEEEKLTDGHFVEEVAHQDHPRHPTHSGAEKAAGTGEDSDGATAGKPQQ
jgi:hypothetical protein